MTANFLSRLLLLGFILSGSSLAMAQGSAELVKKIPLASTRISGLAAHPNVAHHFVFVTTDGTVVRFDATTGRAIWSTKALSPLRGHEQLTILNITAFSADGAFIAIGRSTQAEILVLRVKDGAIIQRLVDVNSAEKGILSLQFSPDSRLLFVSHWRSAALSMWNIAAGQEIFRLQKKPVIGSIHSPDPSYAFTALNDNSTFVDVYPRGIRLWNKGSQGVFHQFGAPRLDPFEDAGIISAASVSPDGRMSALLVRSSSANKTTYALVLHNNENGKIEGISDIPLTGDQFAWIKADFQHFVIAGFAAGQFFSWNALSKEPPKFYKTHGEWLNPQYAWPAQHSFQGVISGQFAFALTIVDTGVLGLWHFTD